MKNNLNWRDNWRLKLQAQNINVVPNLHNRDHVVMETSPLQWPFFNSQLSEYQIIFKKPPPCYFYDTMGQGCRIIKINDIIKALRLYLL